MLYSVPLMGARAVFNQLPRRMRLRLVELLARGRKSEAISTVSAFLSKQGLAKLNQYMLAEGRVC